MNRFLITKFRPVQVQESHHQRMTGGGIDLKKKKRNNPLASYLEKHVAEIFLQHGWSEIGLFRNLSLPGGLARKDSPPVLGPKKKGRMIDLHAMHHYRIQHIGDKSESSKSKNPPTPHFVLPTKT